MKDVATCQGNDQAGLGVYTISPRTWEVRAGRSQDSKDYKMRPIFLGEKASEMYFSYKKNIFLEEKAT